MKKLIMMLISGLLGFTAIGFAQENDRKDEQQTVTEEQKTAVKGILSKYDIKALTADEAKEYRLIDNILSKRIPLDKK